MSASANLGFPACMCLILNLKTIKISDVILENLDITNIIELYNTINWEIANKYCDFEWKQTMIKNCDFNTKTVDWKSFLYEYNFSLCFEYNDFTGANTLSYEHILKQFLNSYNDFISEIKKSKDLLVLPEKGISLKLRPDVWGSNQST